MAADIALTTIANWLGNSPALLRYCDDGAFETEYSAAERVLRGVPIGRRSQLFAGADGGGERAAAIYSPIGTARLHCDLPHRVHPCKYQAKQFDAGKNGYLMYRRSR